MTAHFNLFQYTVDHRCSLYVERDLINIFKYIAKSKSTHWFKITINNKTSRLFWTRETPVRSDKPDTYPKEM